MSAVQEPMMNASTAAPLDKTAPERPLRSARLASKGVRLSNGAPRVRALLLTVLPPVFGIALLVLLWQILSMNNSSFPTPAVTFADNRWSFERNAAAVGHRAGDRRLAWSSSTSRPAPSTPRAVRWCGS